MRTHEKIQVYVTSYSEEVTGSCNHVKVLWPDGRSECFLVDCGLFQEKEHLEHNTEKFVFNPNNIRFCIATHVHTDHVGRLPYLIKEGFEGYIYTSNDTKQMLPVVLAEASDRLQEEYNGGMKKYRNEKLAIRKLKQDQKGRGKRDKQRREYAKKNRYKVKQPMPVLIYTRKDIEPCINKTRAMELYNTFSPCEGIEITFYPNAHIGGAVLTVCRVFDETQELHFLFTGDLGLTNPVTGVETYIPNEVAKKIDFVVSEATYGCSKGPKQIQEERERHIKILKDACNANQTIMYMSNSLERPQRVCHDLKTMQEEKVFEHISDYDIYLDTTFGIKCHTKYEKMYGKEYLPKNFKIITKDSREQVIAQDGPKMIICTSPRLYQGSFLTYGSRMLRNPNVTLIFVAYVPENVRNIINLPRGTEIEFMGEKVALNCKMHFLGYYSSHVDTPELDSFLNKFTNANAILFTHGVQEAKGNYVDRYKTNLNSTHNLLYSKTVMLTKDGIEKYY